MARAKQNWKRATREWLKMAKKHHDCDVETYWKKIGREKFDRVSRVYGGLVGEYEPTI